MKIDFNKIIITFIYINVFVFLTICILPMISVTITNKLYYEMNNKIFRGQGNNKDLLIDNVYEQIDFNRENNMFSIELSRLPVQNFQYNLPSLELFFVCDNTEPEYNSNVNFIEVLEYLNHNVVRKTIRNVYCSNENFNYFNELNELTNKYNSNNFLMRLLTNENLIQKSESEKLSLLNNVNKIEIKDIVKDTPLTSKQNFYYNFKIINENKSIKLLANSKVSFKYDINDEIFIKKIIAKHSVLFKILTFIGVYNFMTVTILILVLTLQNLIK